MVCEEGDKLTYSKYGRFCHEVKINYSPYVNYFTRVYWNRSYFVYKVNTVISFQSWKWQPSLQRPATWSKMQFSGPAQCLADGVWMSGMLLLFPGLLLIPGCRVLLAVEDQVSLSFSKISSLLLQPSWQLSSLLHDLKISLLHHLLINLIYHNTGL